MTTLEQLTLTFSIAIYFWRENLFLFCVTMVERVEDMQLPNAVVQRIIKEALPDGINVAKDARSEISKAASIFVLYLTSSARQKTQKKTLAPGDVLSALEGMEMEHFVEPLKRAMEGKEGVFRSFVMN